MKHVSPSLSDVDLRLLQVFQSVVRFNGFSAAQEHLGLTQATISNHMNQLEERLGMRLCERGRKGFYLTEQGKIVHAAMLDLFGSIDNFRSAVGSARGELSGTLHIGTVDAMHTNPELDLSRALASFSGDAPKVEIEIDIASPQRLVQGLLSRRYHVIITPEQKFMKSMRAVHLFDEVQRLYCGADHPLFDVPDTRISPGMLESHPFVGRTYMSDTEICGLTFERRAVTSQMESAAALITSGRHLGFLPVHFAQQWVDAGRIRCIRPGELFFDDPFFAVRNRSENNLVAETFIQAVERAAKAPAPA